MDAISIDSLKEDFELLDWEDRYRYVIELGRKLDPLADRLRKPQNKVQGCASQVWIASSESGEPRNPRLDFVGDSDALIVKGLIAIVFSLFSGRTARDILSIDAHSVLDDLGLKEHLTPQRSNGVYAMIARIKADALRALGADAAQLPIAGR